MTSSSTTSRVQPKDRCRTRASPARETRCRSIWPRSGRDREGGGRGVDRRQPRSGRPAGLHLRVHDADSGAELVRFDVTAATSETAFVFGELYRRRASGSSARWARAGPCRPGRAARTDYGHQRRDEPAGAPLRRPRRPGSAPPLRRWQLRRPPTAGQAPAKINMSKGVRLDKQLAGQPPEMVNLVKKAGISLEKKGMYEHRARVALCLDISGSMQRPVPEREDPGSSASAFSRWRCSSTTTAPVDVFTVRHRRLRRRARSTFELARAGYVDNMLPPASPGGRYQLQQGHAADPPALLPGRRGGPRNSPRPDKLPVYVMFVTDGQTMDQDGPRTRWSWSSYEPMFWQFMAIGQSSRNVEVAGAAPPPQEEAAAASAAPAPGSMLDRTSSFLEELDDMPRPVHRQRRLLLRRRPDGAAATISSTTC